MRIHLELKDIVVYAVIIAIIVIGGIKIARIEAALQTTALIKTVNDQGAVIQQIVNYLNGKTTATAPAKPPVQAPPTK